MGSRWTGLCESRGDLEATDAGGAPVQAAGRSALVAAAPFGLFYYRRVSVPSGRPGSGDVAYIAGAVDPDLPVAVEDCAIYASRAVSGSYGVFAAERSKLAAWLGVFPRLSGRSPDCIVPAPLVVWRFASAEAGTPAGALVHIHLDGAQWLVLAGRSGAGEVPESITTVEAGDVEGACRSAMILLARMRRGDGDGATVSAAVGPGTPELLAAAGARIPGVATRDLSARAPSVAALAARYAAGGALDGDIVPPEMEGKGMAAVRLRRALPAALLVAASALAFLVCAVRFNLKAAAALRGSDARLAAIAESLAGARLGPRGAAALAPAVNAFHERRNPAVAVFAGGDVRDALRPLFAFAEARSFSISKIAYEGGTLEADLAASDWNDIEALVAELARSGFRAFADRVDPESSGPTLKARVTVESGAAP